jgi:hypothetical protein
MGRGKRLTTTTYPLPYAATLAKESIITRIITQGGIREMAQGKSISISGQTAMKCTRVTAAATDPYAMIRSDRIKATREGLPPITRLGRNKDIPRNLITIP